MQFYNEKEEPIGDPQEVPEGEDAIPPEEGFALINPDGEVFIGWDQPYTNVTEERSLFPVYKPGDFLTLYDGINNSSLKPLAAPYDEMTTLPSLEAPSDGYNVGWFHSSSGGYPTNFIPITETHANTEGENAYVYARYSVIPLYAYYDEESEFAEESQAYLVITKSPYEEVAPYNYFMSENEDGTDQFEMLYPDYGIQMMGIPLEYWTFKIDMSEYFDEPPEEAERYQDVTAEQLADFLREGDKPVKICSATGKAPPEEEEESQEPIG